MCDAMVAFCLWMYSFMGQIPVTSRASSTGGHPHPQSPACRSVFPIIFIITRWWKPSITANVAPFITHISLPYNAKLSDHRLVHHLPCLHHRSCLHKYSTTIPHRHQVFFILFYLGCPVDVILCNCAAQVQEGRFGIHCLQFHTIDHPTGLKTVLEGLPSPPPLLPKPALILVLMAVI